MTLSAAARRTDEVSEKDFQKAVIEMAERLGWKVAHFHDSRRQVRERDGKVRTIGDKAAAGFPDLVLVHRGESTQTVPRNCRLVFAELKREKGRPSPAQADWLEALGLVLARGGAMIGQEERSSVYLWRPSDWPLIERVLARRSTEGWSR